jgi:hypothetical protein
MEFRCKFIVIPQPEFNGEFPSDRFDIDDEDLETDCYRGILSVNFAKGLMAKGSFKTAHPGRIRLDDNVDHPPFTNGMVCVKQIYEKRGEEGEKIGRVPGRYEANALSVECNVLQWASILLDMTYQFVEREITLRGEPHFQIPRLRFTKTMVALVKDAATEKAFLVEEWINTDEVDNVYTKYITNCHSQPVVPVAAHQDKHDIATFLVFAQHVQWQKTYHLAFTSDYQGAGLLLSDPQIISKPYVNIMQSIPPLLTFLTFLPASIKGKNLFGDGNLQSTFHDFRTHHQCNYFCKFFGLTLEMQHEG